MSNKSEKKLKTKIGILRDCELTQFMETAKLCFTDLSSEREPVHSELRKRVAISIAAWGRRDPVDSLERCFDENLSRYFNFRVLRATSETSGDRIIGFAVFVYRKFLTVDLLLAGIHPDFQKRGYGRRLITGLATMAKKKRSAYGFPLIVARVAETDLGTQLFFKSCGFVGTKTIERENETFYEMILYQRPPRPYRRRKKKPVSEKVDQK